MQHRVSPACAGERQLVGPRLAPSPARWISSAHARRLRLGSASGSNAAAGEPPSPAHQGHPGSESVRRAPLPASAAGTAKPHQPHSPYPDLAALDAEIISIALPMLATLAADPIAGLVDSAYMGRAGAAQLAAVGVALSVFNTCTKVLNVPLLAVTTSSVAKATGGKAFVQPQGYACMRECYLAVDPHAVALLSGAHWLVGTWGVSAASKVYEPALAFVTVRAAGAPITILMLTLQASIAAARRPAAGSRYLVLRSASVTATYAVATSLVARAGAAVTASHQIAFQLWLACGLLADALAVAAQSLMARDIGAGSAAGARQVAGRVGGLSVGLGLALAGLMALAGRLGLPAAFSSEPEVLRLVSS
eukprot:XP_001696157.1 MATE efflux family protein [Chlamydomonas reinhardtii]